MGNVNCTGGQTPLVGDGSPLPTDLVREEVMPVLLSTETDRASPTLEWRVGYCGLLPEMLEGESVQ